MPHDRHLKALTPPGVEAGTILLETERLILRRYLLSDAPAKAVAANHESIARNLRDGFPSPYTLEKAENFLRMCTVPSETGYPTDVAILVKPGVSGNSTPEPVYIGGIGASPQRDVNYRTWELGYWLTPSAWGKGYMTEAVEAFVRWCFATWPQLNRFEADMYARNESSGKVLLKCGFIEEGRKRGNAEKNGELQDTILYGLVRADIEKPS